MQPRGLKSDATAEVPQTCILSIRQQGATVLVAWCSIHGKQTNKQGDCRVGLTCDWHVATVGVYRVLQSSVRFNTLLDQFQKIKTVTATFQSQSFRTGLHKLMFHIKVAPSISKIQSVVTSLSVWVLDVLKDAGLFDWGCGWQDHTCSSAAFTQYLALQKLPAGNVTAFRLLCSRHLLFVSLGRRPSQQQCTPLTGTGQSCRIQHKH